MMSRTYHLLVLPIFAGFLALSVAASVTLGLAVTTSLARTTTATTAYTIRTSVRIIIFFIALFISTHFGCPHLKIGIQTIAITISHGSTIIGNTIVSK